MFHRAAQAAVVCGLGAAPRPVAENPLSRRYRSGRAEEGRQTFLGVTQSDNIRDYQEDLLASIEHVRSLGEFDP